MLALRLSPEIERRLEELANRTGRTKSFYAREAIIRHLEDLEDLYIGEAALDEFRKSGEESVALEDLMKEYGL